ncbi:hypothetical protein CNR22_21210 [Sphingobacteriaceae bacterium]|nr:hypothetical protein CNR22_21210 [Sphingobacteriaceae bacterium]
MKLNYLLLALLLNLFALSQNEAKKWYFGNQSGLDFSNSPPTSPSNGAMLAYYSCASIADASGNLLFYTDGATIYNSSHTTMANGSGLMGSSYSPQGSIIVKKPGSSTIYYVFTADYVWSTNSTGGLYYTTVDMSLSSGSGSVTSINTPLYSGYITKLTGTKHCDGLSVWLVTQETMYYNSTGSGTFTPSFVSFSVTAAGVNTFAVVSPGMTYTYTNGFYNYWGAMKISPNGKKLGLANYDNGWNTTNSNFELYDFDISTGLVSNPIPLSAGTASNYGGWGCEFSPDGTHFYGSSYYWNSGVVQWDLCAGSPTAVIASAYTVNTGTSNWGGTMQLAPDGKIYLATYQSNLDVINSPNSTGSACAYSVGTQSLTASSYYSLPNFLASSLLQHPTPTPFTHTVSNGYGCQAVLFNSSYTPSISVVGCSSSGFSLTALKWIFGDPASGASNTSTAVSPIHAFTTLGTYSVNLVLYYSCGGGTDTLKQTVNVNQPCISVSSTSITCANLGSATVQATGGIGPFSYTWMPTSQTNSVATGLSPGTYTLTVFDFGTNFTYTASTSFTSLIPLTGSLSYANNVKCFGASSATAAVTNIAGGSGTENYLWQNSNGTTSTSPTPLLSAGLWSLTVTDAVTGCQIIQSFYISQQPAQNLILSTSNATICAGKTVTLTGVNSGGTPYTATAPYTYSWTGGPQTDTRVATQAFSGQYVYSLTSKDSYSCAISKTIAVDYINNPVLNVTNSLICPLETGIVSVSGASTYTWNNNSTGSNLSDSPVSNTQYTVIGSALGCTSSAVASIILKPTPFPLLNSNSPICEGQNLNLSAFGGVSYLWSGPLNWSSNLQSPVISSTDPTHSGTYTAIVIGANSCTASVTKTVLVNPTPTLSAVGSTVCNTQTLNLYAYSFPGANYVWNGPNTFSSNAQNPTLVSPPVATSGDYTVRVTSAAGCTNLAVANVTVTAIPIPTIISNNPQCFGSTLTFNGKGGSTYQWTGPAGFTSTLQAPSIPLANPANSGNYNLLISLGPCTNNAVYNATVFPLPSFTVSSNSPVCETKSLSLTSSNVSNAAIFLWQGPNWSGSQSQNAGRDSSKVAFAGVYTLTIIDQNTCENTATHTVSINQNPKLIPVSTTVCLNQPATLSVTGAASYVWLGPDFYQSYDQYAFVPLATSPAPTHYTVVGTAANQCTSVANASITTLSLPSPALTIFPGNKICLDKKVILEGFGGQSYEWKGPGNYNYRQKILTFTASSMSYVGTYTLVATDEKGCTNFTTTTLDIGTLPQGSLISSIPEACVPFQSDFKYYSALPSSQIKTTWQINNEPGFTANTFSRNFKVAGDYLIKGLFLDTVTTCERTYTFVVHARPVPSAEFTYQPENPVEGLDHVMFYNASKGEEQSKWNWYFINNAGAISTNENSSYFFENAGIYPVAMIVKNKWGCSDTVMKAIHVNPDFNVFVPNVFTPNGDSDNDSFLPVLTGVKHYELSVFNRWGTRVFQTTDYTMGWDGKFNGEESKNDVYVWKISVSSQTGEAKNLQGHVTLYR